jgi:hypothetical protein
MLGVEGLGLCLPAIPYVILTGSSRQPAMRCHNTVCKQHHLHTVLLHLIAAVDENQLREHLQDAGQAQLWVR